eukprot:TRINITY_DN2921_c0_g2_i1.p1 TRINITY_DN2921_c0_g2~~TRINITY_DN2921_c0_g2_i1.p1  ORF type:complete len:197 (-),score=20.13 TRINITY_DN2921_c0_g2_i1:298-888(-)
MSEGSPRSEEAANNNNNNNNAEGSVKEQDRFLPIANVSRIMKKALPANAKISKDAKETVQECVSEFISFITGEASDKCQKEKRKTINGDDLLWAMGTLGFENYLEPLKLYLHKYREMEGEKTSLAKHSSSSSSAVPGDNSPSTSANGGASSPGTVTATGASFGGGLYYGSPVAVPQVYGHPYHRTSNSAEQQRHPW